MKDKLANKRVRAFLAGIIALAIFVGTWAYYTSTTTINNDLKTKGYGNRTVEEFTPDEDWQPGETVTKTAAVTNTGDYALVVRVKFDETWSRNGSAFQSVAYNEAIDTVQYQASPQTWRANQANGAAGETDGLTNGDETVVYKLLNSTEWTKGIDGYFYYNKPLEAGNTTENLLNTITLADNTDIGVYTTTNNYYSTTPKATIEQLKAAVAAAADDAAKKQAEANLEAGYAWNTTKPADVSTITYMKSDNKQDGAGGYGNADYTLTITTETCQATQVAVDSTWGMTTGNLTNIKNSWTLE